jgi:hypothetical protein
MSIDANDVLNKMMSSAESAFGVGWNSVKQYAPSEFKKMALQIAEIAENVALYKVDPTKGYSEETGKLLLKMQRNACESVLVAVTQLTMIAVQKALDAILKILKDTFQGAIVSIL